MKKRCKKLIAPIIVTVILIVYFVVYFGVLISAVNGFLKYLLGMIPLALTAVAVYVCIERIQEIRSGEEDDLSQY